MTAALSTTSTNRVIALVDMDCFYVQVEERDDPSIKGVPAAVVQYKAYKGGGIIAVNYEARAKGVTRNIRGDDAKAVCPEIRLVRVPESRGKADLTKYRDAGREVINVLTDFSSCVERASIDEAYIDLTESVELRLAEISSSQDKSLSWSDHVAQSLDMTYLDTNFVLGYDSTKDWINSLTKSELPSIDDFKLAVGAEIVGKMRDAVYQRTNFRCSAGIAHNKVLAKLVCGINKPNKQTVLPHESVANLWSRTKIGKVRGLGGKLGEFVESLGCVFMSDIRKFSEKDLNAALGSKTGAWLFQLSRGYDDEAVTPRQLPKSIGCNKNFFGPEALKTKEKAKFWIDQLASEVVERVQRDLETNNRRAKTLTLHVKFENQNALSRSCGAPHYNAERMAADVLSIMEKLYQTVGVLPINSLGLIASKFEDEIDVSSCSKINNFFKVKSVTVAAPKTSDNDNGVCNNENNLVQHSTLTLPATTCKILDASNLPTSNLSMKNDQLALAGTNKSPCVEPSIVSKTVGSIPNGNEKTAFDRRTEKSQTPKKSDPLNDEFRKPFFQYLETAPKPLSPLKSPRKQTNPLVAQKNEAFVSKDFSDTNALAFKECERCNKKILEWEFESHMDYHFAKDLSREINGLPSSSSDIRSTGTTKQSADTETKGDRGAKLTLKRPRGRGGASSTGSKRGRGAKSTSTSVPNTSRTIDSYFAPKA